MRRCLLICALLLSACGEKDKVVVTATKIPDDLLRQERGWTGPVPATETQFLAALFATERARISLNAKLGAIADIAAGAQ